MAKTKNGIEYPDNYDSVADIPSDLKKMAESIDKQIEKKVEKENGKGLSTNDFTNADKEKLDGLNNYDDTEIKEEISDIQKEQKIQNEDISTLKAQKEALEKEVQNLREDNRLNTLTEDNEGELVHIDNSTGARFNSLEIEGNEKQETREGYNLFDILNATIQNQDKGVTITKNEDGSITANGTPSADWIVFIRDYGIGSKLEDGQTYSLWQENYAEEDMEGVYVQVVAKPNEGSSQTQKIYNASTIKKTFTVDKTNYNYQLAIQTGQISKAGTFENYKNRYMLYKGTDDKEFELYGAMPSFDYSSEVKCVGDNINIFDGETELGGFGETGDKTNSSTTIRNKNPIYVKGLNKIIFSCNSEPQAINFYEYDKNNSFLKYTNLAKNKYLELDTNTEYVNFSRNNNIDVSKIKVESGEKITDYSKFGQGNLHLKICNKNILDVPKNSTVTKAGMTVSTDKDGILTLNGTTTSAIYIGLNKNNFIMQSGNLFERSMFRKGNYNFSVDNLSSMQTLNASAYIRKSYYSGEIIYLESVFSAKHRDKNFILEEDKEAVVYLWIASGITLNNAKLKFQLELAQGATDIVANEEQNYVIPVQQRMFKQDKFIKINGVWKEMHTMGTVYSKDVSNIVVSGSAVSGVDGFYRYNVNLGISNRKGGSYIRLYSNYFKYGDSRWNNKEGICGWENGQIFSLGTYNKNYDTADKLKEFLTENNVEFDYELAKPLYLDCTDEQIVVLDKIEQEAHTFADVTNVFTEDAVGAIIKTNTAVDLKTVINNVVEAQLQEIGG